MFLDNDEHVYCTNCDNFKTNIKCHNMGISSLCNVCVCRDCYCYNPEDSASFESRPNYRHTISE